MLLALLTQLPKGKAWWQAGFLVLIPCVPVFFVCDGAFRIMSICSWIATNPVRSRCVLYSFGLLFVFVGLLFFFFLTRPVKYFALIHLDLNNTLS